MPHRNMYHRRRYEIVCVGGTFNVLHKGHKALLSKAFEIGDFVKIGVTSDQMASNTRGKVTINPYEKRKGELVEWLNTMGYEGRYEIEVLNDPYGSAITDESCEAIVVSSETMLVAEKINSIRKDRGLKSLEIHVIPMVRGEDGSRLKSTRILLGLQNMYGTIEKELVFAIGSANETKVMGAINAIRRLFIYTKRARKGVKVIYGPVETSTVPQPTDYEIIKGAVERAQKARAMDFNGDITAVRIDCEGRICGVEATKDQKSVCIDFALGIEAGVIHPCQDMRLGTQYCIVIDKDDRLSMGQSASFPIPDTIMKAIERGNMDLEDAIYQIYFVKNIGDSVGAIGLLSDGIVTREEITEQCTIMALIRWCWNFEKAESTHDIEGS